MAQDFDYIDVVPSNWWVAAESASTSITAVKSAHMCLSHHAG